MDTWRTNKDKQTAEVISTLVKDSSTLSIDEHEINIDKAILDELTATLGQVQVKELLQIYLTECWRRLKIDHPYRLKIDQG